MSYCYALLLSYDGTPFFGWQKTEAGPSIQEALETACAQVLGEPVQCEAASRTDRGVHAEGQVVQFRANKEMLPQKLLLALNSYLPKEIRVQKVFLVPPSFHPTLDATSKTYHYYLCFGKTQLPFHRRFSWHYRYPIDLRLMTQAARQLIGTHDFSAFTTERVEDPIRTLLDVNLSLFEENRLKIEMRGDRFLYKMARTVAGTLAQIGSGKLPPDWMAHLFHSKRREEGGLTAPPHGLFLFEVYYSIMESGGTILCPK
jgi:tRNA pseudouridine38-40 synthase